MCSDGQEGAKYKIPPAPFDKRLCRNSSSRPNPAERDASRDPEVREMLLFLWIPDLAMLRIARPE